MTQTKLSKFELQIMEILWSRGPCSVREIQEALPESRQSAYNTVQTVVGRLLENKNAVKIVKRIGNANIFEAAISRDDAGRKLFDDLRALFGGGTKPVMAHLIKTGQLTLSDIQDAERALRDHQKERRRK